MFDMSQGVCQNEKDLDVFFPNDDNVYDRETLRYAKSICMKCPVQKECRDMGLTMLDEVGVWGGLTEKERRRVVKGTDKPKGHALAVARSVNADRPRMALEASIHLYKQVLEEQLEGMPLETYDILQARINNPDLSLSQIGELLGTSKDVVSGRLRRVKDAMVSGRTIDWAHGKIGS
jgi:WhiB family redox-sensing transcriptional regulator